MTKSMTAKSDAEQRFWNALAEARKETKESRRESRESSREFRKQLSEMAQETKESSRKLEKQLKAIREEYGGYTNRESRILKDEFLAALLEKKQVSNIHLDYVLRVGSGHEYDLVGVNSEVAVVGEIKCHLRVQDVKEFVGKVSKHFAQDLPEYARPKIYGMVAGESITEAAAVSAKKCGLFILRLKNKSLVVENSKNAKPLV